MLLPKSRTAGTGPAYRRSAGQERASADRLARIVKGSGRLSEKGDARAPSFARVECKCTAAESFRVTSDMLDKIHEATLGSGELGYIEVELGVSAEGRPSHRLAVIPIEVLETVLMHYHHVKHHADKKTA